MKTKFRIRVCLLAVFLSLLCVSGCFFNAPKLTHPREYYGIREVGDFVVHFFSNDECAIKGTTEQGNTKKYLIIPTKIEDSPVTIFGDQLIMATDKPIINSKVLEKVYFKGEVERNRGYFDIKESPNLKKFICLTEWEYPSYRFGNYTLYNPRYICEVYAQKNPEAFPLTPANVSYFYNYKDAENHGYYWVDDCEYSGKIEFLPENPIREGYDFAGWYKEAECINGWDFENDTLPDLKTEKQESFLNGESVFIDVPIYQETILYAKWVKNSFK